MGKSRSRKRLINESRCIIQEVPACKVAISRTTLTALKEESRGGSSVYRMIMEKTCAGWRRCVFLGRGCGCVGERDITSATAFLTPH